MTRVLYLHGFASGPGSKKAGFFRETLEAAGLSVEIPDLAEGDFPNLTISGQLRLIEGVAVGQPVSLIGSSMGGYLAALYAARHPEVPAAVLLAPAFCLSRRWHDWLGPVEMETWRQTGWREFFHYGLQKNYPLGYQLIADAQRYEDYPDFQQPALIFHGRHDDAVPVTYSQQFAATHPNATLEILDSDHELLNSLDHMAARIAPFLTNR